MEYAPFRVDVPLTMDRRPLSVVLVSVARDARPAIAGGYRSINQPRSTHLLTYIDRGCNQIRVGGTTHRVARGEALFVWAGETLEAAFGQDGSAFTAINIAFTTRQEDGARLRTLCPRHLAPAAITEELGAAVRRLHISTRSASQVITLIDLQAVLLQCQRVAEVIKDHGVSRPVRRALAYVQQHADRTLRRDEIAQAIGVSCTYLSAVVRQQTGETLSTHVRRARMNRACDLLEDSRLSITAVAVRLGMDSAQFAKMFHRFVGVSPSQYRRSLAS